MRLLVRLAVVALLAAAPPASAQLVQNEVNWPASSPFSLRFGVVGVPHIAPPIVCTTGKLQFTQPCASQYIVVIF